MKRTISRLRTFLKYRELFIQLVTRDIKLKYRRSVLGYVWSVLNPLLTMLVLLMVFSNLFSRNVNNFPIYLLTGQLLFNFLTIATSRCLSTVIDNASVLKKIYVPNYIFTVSSVSSEFIFFIFSFGALFILIIATGVPVTWKYIFIVIPIAMLYVFCLGLGLFLAQATVFFRDVMYIWSVVIVAWQFLSAIFYPAEILPGKIHFLVTNFNPMFFYITMFRNFVLGSTGISTIDMAIRGAIAAVLMLVLGIATFSANKNKFILYI